MVPLCNVHLIKVIFSGILHCLVSLYLSTCPCLLQLTDSSRLSDLTLFTRVGLLGVNHLYRRDLAVLVKRKVCFQTRCERVYKRRTRFPFLNITSPLYTRLSVESRQSKRSQRRNQMGLELNTSSPESSTNKYLLFISGRLKFSTAAEYGSPQGPNTRSSLGLVVN